jgi:hypothetical protein
LYFLSIVLFRFTLKKKNKTKTSNVISFSRKEHDPFYRQLCVRFQMKNDANNNICVSYICLVLSARHINRYKNQNALNETLFTSDDVLSN